MNTKIANRIWIEDPTKEVIEWAKENLRFPNPMYEKRKQMGYWTGNIPKELRLFEWDGNKLILPFGVCREIMPMLRGTSVYCDFRQDNVISYGLNDMGLYDYQKEAVQKMIEAKYGILKAGCGAGKTICGLALVKAHRRRALWLCNKLDLIKQSMDRAKQFIDPSLFGTITEGKVDVGIGITFATVQTMCKLDLTQYRDYWDVVIVDECFPQYTLIDTINGRKAINKINPGEFVLTLNQLGEPCYKEVLTVFKKKPQSMVRVSLHGAGSLYCTANHPILTQRGYISAGELTSNDAVLCMRDPSRSYESDISTEIQLTSWEEEGVLLGLMQSKSGERLDGGTQRTQQKTDEGMQRERRFRQDEEKQSVKTSGNTGKNIQTNERDRTHAFSSWWKRIWGNSTTDNTNECDCVSESNIGTRYSDKDPTGEWLSDELQGRHCYPRINAGDRDRWTISLPNKETETRREENFAFEYVGVDGVEVQQQTSDGTYGGLCPDGYVYNLEVEGNHNYFACGVNVHNCHNVCASATTFTMYEKVLNHLAARHRYGLTATDHRSDGLIKATFALIGNVMYEIPKEATADRVTDVKIRTVETETELTDECLNTDGTIDYAKLLHHIVTDDKRNRLILDGIVSEEGKSCIILSDRLEQLETIRNLLPTYMYDQSVYINGKMTSKAAKKEREDALEQMRTGEKKYLFGSYKIAREGLDIPCLERLFMASPVKDLAVVEQSVGRIRRVADGKTDVPVVYDYRDGNIGMCCGWYKKRCSVYRNIGAEIERR